MYSGEYVVFTIISLIRGSNNNYISPFFCHTVPHNTYRWERRQLSVQMDAGYFKIEDLKADTLVEILQEDSGRILKQSSFQFVLLFLYFSPFDVRCSFSLLHLTQIFKVNAVICRRIIT